MQQQMTRTETPGMLVTVTPLPQYDGRIPARTGIVVGAWGDAESASMVLVWFWGLGPAIPGHSVHAIFPREMTPLTATLTTMPLGAFESIQRGITAAQATPALPLAPLAEASETAAAERQRP